MFSNAANMPGGRVAALLVPGGSAEGSGMPRSEIDAYTQFVGIYGAKGLAYIRVNDISKGAAGLQSPIVKNLTDEAIRQIKDRQYALKFAGRMGEEPEYTGRILAVGIAYSKDDPGKRHECKVEVLREKEKRF